MSTTELPARHAEPPARHAELMDGVYRWQRHIYDLTRKYYLLGRDRLIT
ncbi:SAM-dependent methyltransferase, partial [Mesorhizobium sp. M5C.F.Ca.IN.020.14.1.1]